MKRFNRNKMHLYFETIEGKYTYVYWNTATPWIN